MLFFQDFKMVRGKDVLPNSHYHKNWQSFVKTWFNQPFKKIERKQRRVQKDRRLFPRPMEKLRSIVRCPTRKYNTKKRVGRGFTIREIKKSKFNPSMVKSMGIAIDYRRKHSSNMMMQTNIARLREYMNNLLVLRHKPPVVKRCFVRDNTREREKNRTAMIVCKKVNKLKAPKLRQKSMIVTEKLKKLPGFVPQKKVKNTEPVVREFDFMKYHL